VHTHRIPPGCSLLALLAARLHRAAPGPAPPWACGAGGRWPSRPVPYYMSKYARTRARCTCTAAAHTSDSTSSVPVPALARDTGAPRLEAGARSRRAGAPRAVIAAPSPLPVGPSPPPQPPPCAMLLVVLAGTPVRIEQGVRGSSTAARTIGSTAADRSGRRYVVRREARSARL
jgi:hypothetical protein